MANKFKKVQGVGSVCGTGILWKETSIYVEWIFGKHWYIGDIAILVCEKLEISRDEIKKQNKSKLDKIVREIVKTNKNDFCDMVVMDVIIELTDKNKIITTAIVL